jgi:hypothetical protein
MKTLFIIVLVIQALAYLWLGWVTFFSRQDAQIPTSYIVLHIVAAIHLLCLLVALGTLFSQEPGGWLRIVAILLSLPTLLGVAVAFVIKMVHRWT